MSQTRNLSGDAVARLSSPRPAAISHTGRWAALEPIHTPSHCAELFAVGHEGKAGQAIWDYLPYGPFGDEAAFQTWFTACKASTDPLYFAIRDLESGRLAGMMSYLSIEPDHRSIEIGHIWFAPFLQKTRAATEVIFLSLRHAFDDLDYRRMEWKCNALNEGSRGAALRFGFQHEGIFYRHRIIDGHNRDTAWYSITDEEWPAVRAGFEAWLDAGNFNEAGQQKERLADLIARERG